jgi:hypothetical protein
MFNIMKKLILSILVLFWTVSLKAQNCSCDTIHIPGIKKITAAQCTYYKIAFCTGGKWGLFDRQQNKVIVKPSFERIFFDGANFGFYGMIKNKLGLYGENGEELIKPLYARIGFFSQRFDMATFFVCDTVILRIEFDSTGKFAPYTVSYIEYNEQFDMNRYVVTIDKNLAYINNSGGENEPLPYITRDGTDSVDANGAYVLYKMPYIESSGVLDMKTNKWMVEPTYFSVFKSGENTVCLKHHVEKDNVRNEGTVYNKKFEIIHSIAHTEFGANQTTEDLKYLLPFHDHSKVEICGVINNYGNDYLCLYKINKKMGMYDLFKRKLVLPAQYDFITKIDDYTYFTKNGKAGMILNSDEKSKFSTDTKFTRIDIITQRNNDYVRRLRLNNQWYTLNNQDSLTLDKYTGEVETGFNNPQNGIAIDNNLIYTSNWNPKGEMRPYISYITGTDSVIPDPADPSGYNMLIVYDLASAILSQQQFSGAYDIKTSKWVVPQKYRNVQSFANGFLAFTDSINYERANLNSVLYISFYSLRGDLLFKNVLLDSFANCKSCLETVTGLKNISGSRPPAHFNLFTEQNYPTIIKQDNMYGVFDVVQGKWLLPLNFLNIEPLNEIENYFAVTPDHKVGIYTSGGQELIPPHYNEIEYTTPYTVIADKKHVYSISFTPSKGFISSTNLMGPPAIENSGYGVEGNDLFYFHIVTNSNGAILSQYEKSDGYWGFDPVTGEDGLRAGIKNNASARIYSNNMQTVLRLDSIRTIEPVGDNFILWSKNNLYYFTDKNFKLISKQPYVSWFQQGTDIYLGKNDKNYMLNRSTLKLSANTGDYYEEDFDLNYNKYFDIYHNQKFIQSKNNRFLQYIFPSGKMLCNKITPDGDGLYSLNYFMLVSMNGDTIENELDVIGSGLSISTKDNYYRVSYTETPTGPYAYGIVRNHLLRENSNGFDTLKVELGHSLSYGCGNLFITLNDSLIYLQDFSGKTIMQGPLINEMPIEILNENRMLVGFPGKRLMDADGNSIIESLDAVQLLYVQPDVRNRIAFILGSKKGKHNLYDLNGSVITTLMSDSAQIIPQNADLPNGLYLLQTKTDMFPFNYINGVVAPLIMEKPDYFKAIPTSTGGNLYGICTPTYSCIMTNMRKTVYTFKPAEKLVTLNDDSTALVYDLNAKKYKFFSLTTKKYFGSFAQRPVYIGFYYETARSLNYYMIPDGKESKLYFITQSNNNTSLEDRFSSDITATTFKVLDNKVILLTNSQGQMVFDMETCMPLHKKYARVVDRVGQLTDYFILRDGAETSIIKKNGPSVLNLGTAPIDSISNYNGNESALSDEFWLFNKNKVGFCNMNTQKKLEPIYSKINYALFYSSLQPILQIDNNLYRADSGTFVFPQSSNGQLAFLDKNHVTFSMPEKSRYYIYLARLDLVKETAVKLSRKLNDSLFITVNNGKEGIYNLATGKLIYDYKYDSIGTAEEYFTFMLQGKMGLLNKNFKQVLPPVYENISIFFCDTLIAFKVRLNGKCSLLRQDKSVLVPAMCNDISCYSLGYLQTETNLLNKGTCVSTLHGIYNFNGKERIPCKWESIEIINDETTFARVSKNGKTFLLTKRNPGIPIEAKE